MVTRSEVVLRLATAGCVAAEEETDELLADQPDAATIEERLRRRELGEPLAWITGHVRFLGAAVRVDPGVYVPRIQTEELALRAAALLPERGRAADLCTGAGAVAVHLAAVRPRARVVAADIDRRAARCARANGVAVVRTDLASGLTSGVFDVVTAVPPYVPTPEMPFLPADVTRWEPRLALEGGPDGLAVVGRLVAEAARVLRPGGWLLIEIGGDQDAPVTQLLEHHGYEPPTCWADEEGDLRGAAARRPGRA